MIDVCGGSIQELMSMHGTLRCCCSDGCGNADLLLSVMKHAVYGVAV